MSNLEVIARLEIRPDQRERFNAHMAEIMRLTRERDTDTLRCDWFVNEDGTACEVHEMFPNEHALIAHKMNTIEPTVALFTDCVVDHHATLYGEVSEGFILLLTERTGAAPAVFTYAYGLDSSPSAEVDMTGQLEVVARLGVRPGELAGFKTQVAEIVRLTRELDTQTIRYDWFFNRDETECEVHETYVSEQGLVEHNHHVVEAREALFRDYAYGHRMSVYGEISQHMRDLFDKHAGGVSQFSYVQGLAEARWRRDGVDDGRCATARI
jgi:quinol monooxygenase YgiN